MLHFATRLAAFFAPNLSHFHFLFLQAYLYQQFTVMGQKYPKLACLWQCVKRGRDLFLPSDNRRCAMLSTLGRAKALRFASLIAPAAIICPAPAFAQEPDDYYLGERPERNAMVRHIEGNIKIRKWDAFEDLTIGTPISEGDIIESSGRGVIQLGDGTKIAFGEATRLEIATLFEDKEGQVQALFRLDYGRLRLSAGPQSEAYIRIDTPSGTLALENRCNVSLEAGNDRSVKIKVFSGNVAFRNRQDAIRISSGQQLTVYGDNERLDRVRAFNTYETDGFESWAEKHLASAKTEGSQHVPSEIRYYADSLAGHGNWVQVVDVGWCWQPRVAVAGWRPYWRGHWGAYRGGMTWVSYDPFGYLTHHYGRWGWSGAYGWYWIPGVYYSPAWVAWNIVDSFFGWAPLGYYNRPIYWGYGGHRHDLWNVIHYRNLHARNIYHHTIWDNELSRRFPSNLGASRSLTPPWKRGPLMVTRHEFNNPEPTLLRRALSREVTSQRLTAYEQQAGRQVVMRRDLPATVPGSGVSANSRPFEDRASRSLLAERPVTRPSTGAEPRDGRRAAAGDNGNPERGNPERGNPENGSPDRSNPERRAAVPEPRRADTREPAGAGNNAGRGQEARGETRQGQDSNNSQAQRRAEGGDPGRAETTQRREARQENVSRNSGETRDSRGASSNSNSNNAGRQASPPPSSSQGRSVAPPARSSAPPARSAAPPPARSSAPPDRGRNVGR
jgi:hypothetical protein